MAAILECQSAKKSKWPHAKIIVTQSRYDSTEKFFQFHILLILGTDTKTDTFGLVYFLFNFETTQCSNQFDTKLVKIHSGVIEILSMSCFALLSVTAVVGHLGMPNCNKKIKTASYKKYSGTRLDQFHVKALEILSFSCLCYFKLRPLVALLHSQYA